MAAELEILADGLHLVLTDPYNNPQLKVRYPGSAEYKQVRGTMYILSQANLMMRYVHKQSSRVVSHRHQHNYSCQLLCMHMDFSSMSNVFLQISALLQYKFQFPDASAVWQNHTSSQQPSLAGKQLFGNL